MNSIGIGDARRGQIKNEHDVHVYMDNDSE